MTAQCKLAALFTLVATPIAAAQSVHVVGNGGGFAEISQAVAAADDGDTLVVRGGSYAGFSITRKSLAVLGMRGETVRITGTVVVNDLRSPHDVLLRGLLFAPATGADLQLVNNTGSVRVEHGTSEPGAGGGLLVSGSRHVVLCRCDFVGGSTGSADGATLSASRVLAYGCQWTGGGRGGNGCRVVGSAASTFLFASDCVLAGSPLAPAGSGLRTEGVTYEIKLLDSAVRAGLASAPAISRGGVGTVDVIPGNGHPLDIDSPVVWGTTTRATVGGQPAEVAVLLIGAARAPFIAYQPAFGGVIMLAPPFVPLVVGTIPGSGSLDVALPRIPRLRRPFAHLDLQMLSVDLLESRAWIGATATLTVLGQPLPTP